MTNLLTNTEGNLTFNQYVVSDFWTGSVDDDGYPTLSADVTTLADTPYELEFSIAANLAANAVDVGIEVTFGGEVIGVIDHSGAVFADQTIAFDGTGTTETLQFRVLDNTGGAGEQTVDTSGVIPSYEKTVTFMGEEVTVDAFMPGQGLVYQVLGGKLVKFDLTTNSYADLEFQNPFKINSIGFSTYHDLIFGQARQNGTDVLGNAITDGDIIAFDARGKTYKIAESPYKTYIGDTDENGDLWIFEGGIGKAWKLDLGAFDGGTTLAATEYDLPDVSRATSGLADMAYNPTLNTFFGVAHGNNNPGTLFAIDISGLAVGEDIVITETEIAGTLVDGEIKEGMPRSAYGATMVDGEGNVYAGANAGDHDLDGSTGNSGGFYKVVTGEDGKLYLELLAKSPSVSNNDGAMDTRGFDPFLNIDTTSTVLLKEPVLSVAIAEDDVVALSAKGTAKTIDLLANDTVSEGETLTITTINGQEATVGLEISLEHGETAKYLGGGRAEITPGAVQTSTSSILSYTIENENGVTDTAEVFVNTSPVDGTAGDDHMMAGFTDTDGNQIEGSDGADDLVMGYGGNDKIFTWTGADEIWGGSGNDFIRAGDGDDLIYGQDGNDVLDGGAGIDRMIGGAGDDIFYVDHAVDVVSEELDGGRDKVMSAIDFTLGDGFEDLSLILGSGAIVGTGNAVRNTIIGNENDNTLSGLGGDDYILAGEGNDTLDGGDGADNLQGGDGDDLMFGGAGNDMMHGQAGDDIQYGGDGDDILCPNIGDDTMYGGAGDDLLSGLAGADVAYGGLGNDTYKVQDALDTIIEYENEGIDTVNAHVSFTLSDHVENLRLTSTGDHFGHGNGLDNAIYGNAGNNDLQGLGGDDHLSGGRGTDTLDGGDGRDRLFGGKDVDVLLGGLERDFIAGGSGDDMLIGGDGKDKLKGGAGADTLRGGSGNDLLKGNSGADIFIFAVGDGNDVLKGWSAEDTLQFEGLTSEDLTLVAQSDGMLLSYGEDDSLLLAGVGAEELNSAQFGFA